jgi:hypothetical protein
MVGMHSKVKLIIPGVKKEKKRKGLWSHIPLKTMPP